jgi:hypothetical protein
MGIPILYADYIPALFSFIILLIWFAMSITIPDEPPPFLTWGAMVFVILGGATLFMLSPVLVWIIFFGQIAFSVVVVRWMRKAPTFNAERKNKNVTSTQRDMTAPAINTNDRFSQSS